MAQLKTRPNKASVKDFLGQVDDPQKRADCRRIGSMMRDATGSVAKMWGSNIVGYGRYSYSNTAGKNLEWMLTGYSPRKQAISVYIMSGFSEFDELLGRLGKFKTGKSCLYIKRLADVDEDALAELIRASVLRMRQTYETR